jgi:hypothetical protein
MKKFLLPFVCILFVFGSCKKKNEVIPANTITATVDGVTTTYNINISAHLATFLYGGTSSTSLAIQGSTATHAPAGGIAISITSSKASAITKGTFTVDSRNNNPPVYVGLAYTYYDPSSNDPDQPYLTDPNWIMPTTITIRSISSTNVQGTFSGTLVYSQGGASTKTVTNGKFNVDITN